MQAALQPACSQLEMESSRRPDWGNLSADVLSMVAAFSSPGTLAHMRGVCRQWRRSINSNVERACLHGGTEKSRSRPRRETELQVAPPMSYIYHRISILSMSYVEVHPEFVHALAACTGLSSLALQNCFVSVRSAKCQITCCQGTYLKLLLFRVYVQPPIRLRSVSTAVHSKQ